MHSTRSVERGNELGFAFEAAVAAPAATVESGALGVDVVAEGELVPEAAAFGTAVVE